MKKSLFALLMATTCSLAGCNMGGGGDPTSSPTTSPTSAPTSQPTSAPTSEPTGTTTGEPTSEPTSVPTSTPTGTTTGEPTSEPTAGPTSEPTSAPTSDPSSEPTSAPTSAPTSSPTSDPTSEPTTSGEAKQVNLTVRFHVDAKSTEGTAYKKVIDAFNKDYSKYKIKATASFVARTQGDSAYELELMKDKMNGTLPDIITFDSPNCAAYANDEFLWDLSSSFTDEEKNQYITVNSYNGKMYGIPIQESSAGFYYNKNLFNTAGIDVSGISVDNPWTYEEFKNVCAKLYAKGITPVDMRIDATKDETATYLLYPFIYASGGSFVDDTGYEAMGYFNSDASKRGFQFLKDLVSLKYTSYGIGATDFHTGKVGMYLSSGWTIPELDHNFPTTFPNRDSWGLLPYPKDVIAASANGSWSYAIGDNGKAENKAASVTLLKYLANAQSSKTVTDATGMIPANKDVETSYAAGSPEDVLIQQLYKTGVARPTTVGYPQFSIYFRQVISKLGSDTALSTIVDNNARALQNELEDLL